MGSSIRPVILLQKFIDIKSKVNYIKTRFRYQMNKKNRFILEFSKLFEYAKSRIMSRTYHIPGSDYNKVIHQLRWVSFDEIIQISEFFYIVKCWKQVKNIDIQTIEQIKANRSLFQQPRYHIYLKYLKYKELTKTLKQDILTKPKNKKKSKKSKKSKKNSSRKGKTLSTSERGLAVRLAKINNQIDKCPVVCLLRYSDTDLEAVVYGVLDDLILISGLDFNNSNSGEY